MQTTVLHWLRRDLRISDNTALEAAVRGSDRVLPVFVFDPQLLERDDVGTPRVAFLLDSLEKLRGRLEEKGLPLLIRHGDPTMVLPRLAAEVGATTVYANRDYSPFALRRDQAVASALDDAGVAWSDHPDLLLVEPWECRKRDGNPYTVFTPYSRVWREVAKAPARPVPKFSRSAESLPVDAGRIPTLADLGRTLEAMLPEGGEAAAAERLRAFARRALGRYATDRDRPDLAGTSQLSADLRFGTISVRRVFETAARHVGSERVTLDPRHPPARLAAEARERLENGGTFVSELCWRDFYYAVLFYFPHVLGQPFRPAKPGFEWPESSEPLRQAWVDGRTGFPIVDAGMRQLRDTGWMHNRVRMLTASFLTKILLVDWRFGERVFLQRLVDGDPAANNGGWQWSASTGTDAAPYFRIFNPTTQSKKFDPNGDYIRRWVGELADVAAPTIHEPGRDPDLLARTGYPPPCVDYSSRRKHALEVLAKL